MKGKGRVANVSFGPLDPEMAKTSIVMGKRVEVTCPPIGTVNIDYQSENPGDGSESMPYAVIDGAYYIVGTKTTDLGWKGPKDKGLCVILLGTGGEKAKVHVERGRPWRPWDHPGAPNPEGTLEKLTVELNLTADQQARIKPILEAYNNSIEALRRDRSMNAVEKRPKFDPIHKTELSGVNAVLTPDQQTKFASMQAKSHRHGGEASPAASPGASRQD